MTNTGTALTAEDRLEIVEQTCRIFLYCDRHEWQKLTELFTDPLILDYSALLGGTPKTLTPQELSETWHEELGGLDKSHHLLTNHIVEAVEGGARCTANIHATHILANPHGDSTYLVAGRYEFDLKRTERGWLVSGQKATPTYVTGNPAILELGAKKIKAGDRQR